MGVTIGSKSFSADLGYGGFKNFRKKVATLSSLEFGKHYAELETAMFMFGEDKDAFF